MAVLEALSRPVHAQESLAKNAQLAQRKLYNIPSHPPMHQLIDQCWTWLPMAIVQAFSCKECPTTSQKAAPPGHPSVQQWPAHCLPTSSAMPALFPANMRSNACLLPANMLSSALPISNRHAPRQQCMPTANQPAQQCLLGKARQCLLGNCVPWLTIAEKTCAIAEKTCAIAEKISAIAEKIGAIAEKFGCHCPEF